MNGPDLRQNGRGVGIRDPREPEVEDLDLGNARRLDAPRVGTSRYQNVGGFQIAMDHSSLMGVAHRIANLLKEPHQGMHVYGFPGGVLSIDRQGDTVHELHREEVLTIFGPARFVDGRDARILEPRQHLGLALEELHVILWDHSPPADDLQRNGAAGALLFGFVDDSHAPFADLTDDAVRADVIGGLDRAAFCRAGSLERGLIVSVAHRNRRKGNRGYPILTLPWRRGQLLSILNIASALG